MRAVLMRAVGGTEVLKLADVPEPEISGEHDVRLRLRAWTGMDGTDVRNLRVHVGGTFPLEHAADAHRALEAGQVIRKAVLFMQ